MMMQRLGLVLLAFSGGVAAQTGRPLPEHPLPGEQIPPAGQIAPVPADARVVPGFAGAWRKAEGQKLALEQIQRLEGLRTPACTQFKVRDTVQAAPDLIDTQAPRIHHALERWTVEACGAFRAYDVWYRFQPGSSRLAVSPSEEADKPEVEKTLDPAYRRLRELAVRRQAEEARGQVRWLNLPLPADTLPAASQGDAQGWSMDFVPVGEDYKEWTQLVSVQAIARRLAPSAQAWLGNMQATRARLCGQKPGPVEEIAQGDGDQGPTLETYLVCPRVPDTNFAQLGLVRVIEGPEFLYVIQRSWRLPSGERAQVEAASAAPLDAARAFLKPIRLCNPTHDTRACPAPLPR